jgi:hypothetical protein
MICNLLIESSFSISILASSLGCATEELSLLASADFFFHGNKLAGRQNKQTANQSSSGDNNCAVRILLFCLAGDGELPSVFALARIL